MRPWVQILCLPMAGWGEGIAGARCTCVLGLSYCFSQWPAGVSCRGHGTARPRKAASVLCLQRAHHVSGCPAPALCPLLQRRPAAGARPPAAPTPAPARRRCWTAPGVMSCWPSSPTWGRTPRAGTTCATSSERAAGSCPAAGHASGLYVRPAAHPPCCHRQQMCRCLLLCPVPPAGRTAGGCCSTTKRWQLPRSRRWTAGTSTCTAAQTTPQTAPPPERAGLVNTAVVSVHAATVGGRSPPRGSIQALPTPALKAQQQR